MKNSQKAVLFDLYGTLVDIQVDEKSRFVWDCIARDFFKNKTSGVLLNKRYLSLLNKEKKARSEGFLLNSVFKKLLNYYKIPPTAGTVTRFASSFRKCTIVNLKVKPYTRRLLTLLRKNHYKIGLISNTEALLTKYDLQTLRLDSYFDHIVLSSEIGMRKPEHDIFKKALRGLSVLKRGALFIGDNFSEDIMGAGMAGIAAIFISDTTIDNAIFNRHFPSKVKVSKGSINSILKALNQLGFSLSK